MTTTVDAPYLTSPRWLTTKDIAKYYAINVHTAYRVVRQPGFPLTRVGRLFRIREDHFLRWVETCGAPVAEGKAALMGTGS